MDPVVAMMGTAVATLFGLVMWLFKTTLEAARARIEVLESREDSTLNALADAMKALERAVGGIADGVREIRIIVTTGSR